MQDLTSDHDKRHLDAGLPSVLTFNLRRETGNVTLTLEENRRLGENAPVFEGREDEQGEISLVRQESAPITVCSFFIILRSRAWQNKQNGHVPNEDSDQPWYPPSLIRFYYPPEEDLGPSLPIKRTVSVQIGRLETDLSLP